MAGTIAPRHTGNRIGYGRVAPNKDLRLRKPTERVRLQMPKVTLNASRNCSNNTSIRRV